MLRRAHDVHVQMAVIRSLLDEIERIESATRETLSEQMIEELARLGCRVLELASAMTPAPAVSKVRLRAEPEPETAPVSRSALRR